MELTSETAGAEVVRLVDYVATPYRIDTVHLDFRLDETETVVVAETAFTPRDGTAPGTPLVLDGDELWLVEARLDGAPLAAGKKNCHPERSVFRL